MSRIKRTLSSFFFKVDQVVGEIENHDGLIEAAIQEQQKKLTAARVECNRITRRANEVTEGIETLEAKRKKWEERAVNEAGQNKDRAIACIQQAEALAEQIARQTEMTNQYRVASEKMAEEIKHGTFELQELKQKHQFMRARQVTADALGKFGDIGNTRLDNIETSFDRWEVKIGQSDFGPELDVIDAEAHDIERIYVAKENQERFEARLDEVLQQSRHKEGDS